MGEGLIIRKGGGGGAPAPEGLAATFVAKDKLKIGDIVYTIDGDINIPFYPTPLSPNSSLAAAFSPDGATLVLVGSFTGRAKRYTVSGTTITYTNDIYADNGTTPLGGNTLTVAFSPDGATLVIGGSIGTGFRRYTVSGTNIIFTNNISSTAGITSFNSDIYNAAFSPDGATLVIGGNFTGRAKRYTVSGTTITYTNDIYADDGVTALDNWVDTVAFSPDGATLVLGGFFTGRAKRYTVSGTTITYTSDIYADAGTTALNSQTRTASFSPDGATLVLGGNFTGNAKRYTVSGTTIAYTNDIASIGGVVYTAAFSPDGTTLVLGGGFTGHAKRYTVSGTTITFTSNIFADAGTTALNENTNNAVFSPNGSTLILVGGFRNQAKHYNVLDTIITYIDNIYANNNFLTILDNAVYTAAFSPDGATLIIGGNFTGFAKRYTVSGTTITYTNDIYANTGNTPLNNYVNTAAFSPDGATLILGGGFTGFAKRYTVSGTTITYTNDIYANTTNDISLNNVVFTAAFSPNGATLVLGGFFTDSAKRYTVSGTTITFTSNIFADNGITLLSSAPKTAAFSPDGATLVLGGFFTGRAKRYTVSGTTITYTSDIYADAGTTALNNDVNTAAFSPDGATLVLGGNFTGNAKRYTVSGITITYTSDIYADAGTGVLNGSGVSAAFSPDGTTLVLVGSFTGGAKRYTVSGTTITFTSNIFANAGTTALNSQANAPTFSPDGTTLVLGGSFIGRAKRYTISGTTITYTSEAYLLKSLNISVLNNIRSFNSKIAYVTSNAEINENVNVNILSG